jgi:hypothetical protein
MQMAELKRPDGNDDVRHGHFYGALLSLVVGNESQRTAVETHLRSRYIYIYYVETNQLELHIEYRSNINGGNKDT